MFSWNIFIEISDMDYSCAYVFYRKLKLLKCLLLISNNTFNSDLLPRFVIYSMGISISTRWAYKIAVFLIVMLTRRYKNAH